MARALSHRSLLTCATLLTAGFSRPAGERHLAYEMATQKFLRGLQPSLHVPGVTVQFEDLSITRPWLNQARRQVGKLWHLELQPDSSSRGTACGSALVLDDEGTVLLTSHQDMNLRELFGKSAQIGNALGFERDGKDYFIPDFRIDVVDASHDIAIGHIAPSTWAEAKKQFGIGAVALGSTDLPGLIGKEVVMVGYPTNWILEQMTHKKLQSTGSLHAVVGTVQRFVEFDSAEVTGTTSSIFYCREATSAAVLDGISGGAAFVDGKCVGTAAAGNFTTDPNPTPYSVFVPISYSLSLYQKQYPKRAAKLGIFGPVRGAPDSCRLIPGAYALR